MNKIDLVTSVIRYIEKHLSEKLELDEVAQAVHYSKYHLHRVFAETVGMTIHDYAKRRQLTEAAKLLVFSQKTILAIALTAGYESQQSFTTAFGEMYKQTPNQFREREEFYPLQLEFHFDKGQAAEAAAWEKRQIHKAAEQDIDGWMELVRLTVDGFPNLREEEHEAVLRRCISTQEAFIMREKEVTVGAMMISRGTGSIDFLAVHPLKRSQGISEEFLSKAFSELLDGDEVHITTFREGDKADPGHRRALKKLGFAEAELLIEFGYPTQRMVLEKEAAR